jgi:hypothetical protein
MFTENRKQTARLNKISALGNNPRLNDTCIYFLGAVSASKPLPGM